jgi:hypothetical protein
LIKNTNTSQRLHLDRPSHDRGPHPAAEDRTAAGNIFRRLINDCLELSQITFERGPYSEWCRVDSQLQAARWYRIQDPSLRHRHAGADRCLTLIQNGAFSDDALDAQHRPITSDFCIRLVVAGPAENRPEAPPRSPRISDWAGLRYPDCLDQLPALAWKKLPFLGPLHFPKHSD